MARAAAYIRRSSASEGNPGDVSREGQIETIRALAKANGVDPDSLVIFEDWGKSADEEKRAKRTGYLTLLASIAARRFEFVLVYHVDRIVRSLADFVELTRVADGHTTIQAPGLTLTGRDPMAKAFAQIAVVFAELELGRVKQRVHKGFAVRAARGDEFGSFRYGHRTARQADGSIKWERDPSVPLDKVLAVVERNRGNINASCRELDALKIPAPRARGGWGTSALTRIVDREAPKLRTPRGRAGQRQPTRSVLSGLVVCPACDATMTPVATRNALYCYRGSRTPGHGKYFTKAGPILALLHSLTDGRTVTKASLRRGRSPDAQAVAKAEERWRRANIRFQADGISDADYSEERRRWAEARAAADDDGWTLTRQPGVPLVRWDAEPREVNEDLRRQFAEVRLESGTLVPVAAVRRRLRAPGSALA